MVTHRKSRGRWAWWVKLLVAAASVLIALIVLGMVVGPTVTVKTVAQQTSSTQRVPNVTGMTEADAERVLVSAGYRIGVVTQGNGNALWVHKQSPAGWTLDPPGTAVSLGSLPYR